MKVAVMVWALAVLEIPGACREAVSVRPLYTPAERENPVADPRIEGEWFPDEGFNAVPDDGSAVEWTVKIDKANGHYAVAIRSVKPDKAWDGRTTMNFTLRLVPIGGKLFFDAQPALVEELAGLALRMQPLHTIGQLSVEKDFLRVALLDGDWLERDVPPRLRIEKDDDIDAVFIGSTSELRALVNAYAETQKDFELLMYLCRPRTDCRARAFEDMVARKDWSHDPAKFFWSRGDYARAVAVQREYLDPKDAWSQATLGSLLLFTRDFDAGRRAYTTAAALARSEGYARDGIAWSFFLERRFVDAADAATGHSADAIMLGYFSRLRLGDRIAAESWLKQQASVFTGSADDHALLMRLEGRLTGHDGCETRTPTNYAERATCMQAAITNIIDGDPKGLAVGFLERALDHAPNDRLLTLAARIELETLRASRR